MNASVVELADLVLFTPEQAAEIMSGDKPGLVTARSIRDGIRRGDYDYTPMGRWHLLTREQIAAIIAQRCVPATARSHRRKTAA